MTKTRPDTHDLKWQIGNLNDDIRNLSEAVVALSGELKKRGTHPENPCLCGICCTFSKFKKQIALAEKIEIERIKSELTLN